LPIFQCAYLSCGAPSLILDNLESAEDSCYCAISEAVFAKQVDHYNNPWFIFKRYNDAVDGQCAKYMLPKLETRLGGAQDFMESHCYTMTEALRIVPDVALAQSGTFAYR
jgi:hypothetical protein